METSPKKSQELSHSHIIRCTEVPPELFADKSTARRYFRSFGRLKTISFKPKIQTCLVEFATEEGVLNAIELAGEYEGKSFRVERHKMALLKKRKEKVAKDPDWVTDPEVRAELEAMGSPLMPRDFNLRPEGMMVDSPSNTMSQFGSKPSKVRNKPPKQTKKLQDNVKFNQEQGSLIAILKQPAFSVDSKYKVLDARDKLLRLRLKLRQETKSDATVGTCPDMCPEKERLLRVIQHQVALYEQDEDRGLDPKLAVKQYSRSSADQDAPLSHELRPVEVLGMTMGYLMHRIMGMCDTPDVNISEWYHFLWDRTRGIRKDITQQALCCHGSVELVEQCARFHIFCSARLVAEDPSTFDQKINTENLTKCLQTLKYMYHDLQLKGVKCRNEAEFRAYIILLNLNDGNFMWEVQHLHPSIQRSREVKFALDVYSSLDKNNYVKFFKLVNSTSFLNACILMRYFVQVRISALDTFLKCYSPRGTQTSMPLQTFTDILAFESVESSLDFLECHGMKINDERTHLVLDRSRYITEPEYAYVLDRATRIIEAKRTSGIGETVCGGALPPPIHENHTVQNSFNDKGYLTFDSYLTERDLDALASEASEMETEDEATSQISKRDEVDSVPVLPASPPRAVTPPVIFKPPPPVIITTSSVATTFSFFNPPPSLSVTPVVVSDKPQSPKVTTHSFQSFFPAPHSSPRFDPVAKPCSPKQIDYEEEARLKREAEEKKRLEDQQMLERLAHLERLKKELEENKRRLAELKERRKVERQKELLKNQEELRRLAEIKTAVDDVICHLLEVTENRLKTETLARIADNIEKRRAKKAVDKWRSQARLRRKRKVTDFDPVGYFGGLFNSLQEEADSLKSPSQDLALESMKRYKFGSPVELKVGKVGIGKTVNYFALTCDVIAERLVEISRKLPIEIYWKVSFSLPGGDEGRIEKALDRLIQWKLSKSQRPNGISATYYFEKVKGALTKTTRCDSDGLIFIGEDLDREMSDRIGSNFRNCGIFARKPLVLILSKSVDNKTNKLAVLKREGIISDYLILVDTMTTSALERMIEEALVYLASKVEPPPDLEMDTLKSFLVKYLISDLWKKAASFSKWNSNYEECLRNPNTAIYLHNEGLDRLKTILLEESLKEYPKFPEVFKNQVKAPKSLPCSYRFFPNFFNDLAYLKHITKTLNRLYLPKILMWPPKSRHDLENVIFDYCSQVYPKTPEKAFYKLMGALLKDLDLETDFDLVQNVPWTGLIEILALELIDSTDFSLYGTGFVHQSMYEQLVVVYKIDHLKEFTTSDWFYVNHPIIKTKISSLIQEEQNNSPPKAAKVELDICDFNLDRTLELLARRPKNFAVIQDKMKQCEALAEDLGNSYAIHKRILEKSKQILDDIVKNK